MGLVSHALAFGLGYVLGRPGGRQQVVQLSHQVTELAEKPEVKRLATKGRELATEKAHAAKDAVSARVSGKTADTGAAEKDGHRSTTGSTPSSTTGSKPPSTTGSTPPPTTGSTPSSTAVPPIPATTAVPSPTPTPTPTPPSVPPTPTPPTPPASPAG